MSDDFREVLFADGVLRNSDATLTALTGGVSSEIYRVQDGAETFVVKRALAKLNVPDDWFADVSRNKHEVDYIRTVEAIVPGATPTIRAASEEHGYFAMEFLGPEFANWKVLMLGGEIMETHAQEAGRILGLIHRSTWQSEAIRQQFETTANFRQLRTDPYLLTTGRRHPELEPLFRVEVERIESTRLCLVHGDYSPKNMLICGDRLVILDCEVAWFGDPAFDVAFLLNHLLLKAVHLSVMRDDFIDLARSAWRSYQGALGDDRSSQIEPTIPRLLAMLMLARIDGKSPVEYLRDDPRKQTEIRVFAAEQLRAPSSTLAAFIAAFEGEPPCL